MTKETRKDPRHGFVPRYLPWLLAAGMLVIYGLTLNHWVSLLNLEQVARVAGWKWQAEVYNPVTFLVTWPLRWLPVAVIPLAMNIFSALAAAVVLGLLARSVALLPHDRTEAQRLREHSDFSFLTIPTAWLPPLLAVLVCGLQFTFWQSATNFTGDLPSLVIFAFVVWSLLEYRLDERVGRIYLAVALFGAGVTQDFGLTGFAPLLLAALIWVRGLTFFNAAFLLRVLACGLAGLSLFLLLPTLAVVSGKVPLASWWQVLKFNLVPQWTMFKYFVQQPAFRHSIALISLTSLLPIFMMSLRWSAGFGDRSRMGTVLVGNMMHVVFAVLLGLGLWGAFDPPFSAHRQGYGLPCLTFYFLAALSVGYFSGYFLLVSRPIISRRGNYQPPWFLTVLGPAACVAISTLVVFEAGALIWKNAPFIQANNSGILRKYASLMTASLPHTGGILLADSETGEADMPRRLFLIQAELAQEGRGNEFVPVDTLALNSSDYHRFLHKKYPNQWPLVVGDQPGSGVDPRGLLGLLEVLSKTNAIYYLHPSFGYYFETFYPEPHGLVYQLKHLPEDTLLPRLPDQRLQAENQAFWTQAESEAFAPILREMAPKETFGRPHGLGPKLMARLHTKPEVNYNAQLAGTYYSRSLDFWGVEAQRCQALKPAAAHFEMAQKLKPDNLVAGLNLAFNHDLQAGRKPVVDISKTDPDMWGQYRSWMEMVTANGPFDEPSFCYYDGTIFLQGGLLNQSIASYNRVQQLLPDYLPALVSLGELYVFTHRPQLALDTLQAPLANPERYGLNQTNATEINIVASAAYMQQTNLAHGVRLLEREIDRHPGDEQLLTAAAQVYLRQGLFTNALRVIALKLAAAPQDTGWLFSQGFTHMHLKQYPEAIVSLTKAINLQTNYYDAIFNRAVAYLNLGEYEKAGSDYQQLQPLFPKSFQVAYGLGEIAWRQKHTNDAVQYYTVYLDNAPTNTAEFNLIRQRQAGLTGKTP